MSPRHESPGQVLVLFVLFLLMLLGVSALAIDYASWLLVDRNLQNVADHAALAGASVFDDRTTQGSCFGGSGQANCEAARAQAWTSISDELGLGLSAVAITQLSLSNSPANGTTTVTAGGITFAWQERVWVSTPPPTYAAYTTPSIAGQYAQNFGVVFARVDRDVRSFVGGALGIQPQPRHGWATAGALPTDFALEVFCRNSIAPQSGVCANSAGLTIDGQGGILLTRGDIGSNESLTVTATTGGGVVLQSGNMFLVNRTCASSTWRCPSSPPQGGISDGVNGKNAFYMAPLAVPQFESPINGNTVSAYGCSGADATHLCVPRKDQSTSTPGAPGDWTCQTSGSIDRCGLPVVTVGNPSTVTCIGQGGGSPALHYYAIGVASGAAGIQGDAAHPQSNGNEYRNMDDDVILGDADTISPTPANPPTDYVYTDDVNISGAGGPQSTSFIVNLGQSGPRLSGPSTIRYVALKTDGGVLNNTQNPVTLKVRLLPASGSTAIAVDPTVRTLTDVPTRFEFTVAAGTIPTSQFNSLRLEFLFTSSGSTAAADERGGGVSWAEIEHPAAQPPVAPMIAPGYYRSIVIPDNACMILDPTAEYSSLLPYQMPGIYRFGGSGSPNDRKIKVGDGSFLIGDGVTLVFDPDWPNSGSNQGVAIGANGALVLNTMRVSGTTAPCTPSNAETASLNMSAPYLGDLPFSAVCAAWTVDANATAAIRPGQNSWAYCDPANPDSGAHCKERSSYNPPADYRGITFYFTPSGWPPSSITNRFEMQGGSGTEAGIAFRGVMYAPYDDVKITGGNGFNTVGQVLAWTAKFNGGSAYITLDYPYDTIEAPPYLLEPTVDH
jgi:Flp pilus assembly protein TadG